MGDGKGLESIVGSRVLEDTIGVFSKLFDDSGKNLAHDPMAGVSSLTIKMSQYDIAATSRVCVNNNYTKLGGTNSHIKPGMSAGQDSIQCKRYGQFMWMSSG